MYVSEVWKKSEVWSSSVLTVREHSVPFLQTFENLSKVKAAGREQPVPERYVCPNKATNTPLSSLPFQFSPSSWPSKTQSAGPGHTKWTIRSSRLPRRQKRKTLVAWAENLPKSPDLFVCQYTPGPFGKRWSSFFHLPAVRVAMVTKWTLAIKASFPRCCGWSFEVMDTHHASGASVRLAKTPKFN